MKTFPYIHKVAATATAKRAVTNKPKRIALLIFNNEAVNVVEVTSSKNSKYGQGIPVQPQACYENPEYCQGEYYVICDTGKTADVRIEEDILTE